MFSDDLEDKIAQIMRGNFSPAKNVVPPKPLAKPVANSSNYSVPKLDGKSSAPNMEVNPDKDLVSVAKSHDTIVKATNAFPSDIENIESGNNKVEKKSIYQSSNGSLKSSNHASNASISSVASNELTDSGIDQLLVPTNDVAAMILKLQNSSREPSPTTAIDNSSDKTKTVPNTTSRSLPIPTSTLVSAPKSDRYSPKNTVPSVTSTNNSVTNGIAANTTRFEEQEHEEVVGEVLDRSVSAVADESVVDDLLFGEQEEVSGEAPVDEEEQEEGYHSHDLRDSGSDSGQHALDNSSVTAASVISDIGSERSSVSTFRNYGSSTHRPVYQQSGRHYVEMDSYDGHALPGVQSEDEGGESEVEELEEPPLRDSVDPLAATIATVNNTGLQFNSNNAAASTGFGKSVNQSAARQSVSPAREAVSVSSAAPFLRGSTRPPLPGPVSTIVQQDQLLASQQKTSLTKTASPKSDLSKPSAAAKSKVALLSSSSPLLSKKEPEAVQPASLPSPSASGRKASEPRSVPRKTATASSVAPLDDPTDASVVSAATDEHLSMSQEVRMEDVYQYDENKDSPLPPAKQQQKNVAKPRIHVTSPSLLRSATPTDSTQSEISHSGSNNAGRGSNSTSKPPVSASKAAPEPKSASKRYSTPNGRLARTATTPSRPQSPEHHKPSLPLLSSFSPSKPALDQRPVKVAVRVRPFTAEEVQGGARRTIARSGEKLIIVNPKAFDAEPDTIAAAAVAMDNKQWAQIFQFNHFLWAADPSEASPRASSQYVSQEDVFDNVGREIVDNVLNGVSASCFAYGHTGTGKTHSLFGNTGQHSHRFSRSGTPSKGVSASLPGVSSITHDSGLIPRVMHDVVSAVNGRDMFGSDTRMFFSFVEIYNEKILDLLSDNYDAATAHAASSTSSTVLKAREHPVFGIYVENLNKVEVSSPEEVLRLIAKGQSNRTTSSTAWNCSSSRSHAIVTLELSPSNYNQNIRFISPSAKNNDTFLKTLTGSSAAKESQANHSQLNASSASDPHQHLFVRVQMVDLAGSEKDSALTGASSTHDEHGIWKGSRYNDTTPNKLAEAVAEKEKNELKLIRRSLSTLGYIIKALAKGVAFKSLPYRDSVLTFLLRDALNGHNHTTMLATISPSDTHYEETLSTLKYAEKLCSLRSMGDHHSHHHHSHLVNGSMSHSISYGSPVTSLVAFDKDMMQSRKVLLEEFTQIHANLGANKPGSKASKQLHQQTISDPQQRIAKMTKLVYNTEIKHGVEGGHDNEQSSGSSNGSGRDALISTPSSKSSRSSRAQAMNSFTSPVDGSTKDLYSLTSSDLEALKNSYRSLQGQLIELQIDLESVRSDRDSLTVDLRVARDQLSVIEQTKSDSKATIASLSKSFKAAEKEIGEYRALLKKKEDSIERLVSEISTEKQGRLDAEHAYHSRTKDFLARFESMKKENKSLTSNLEVISNKYRAYGDEKKELVAQVDKLKVAARAAQSVKDTLSQEMEVLTAENSALRQRLQELSGKSSTVDWEGKYAELTLVVSRLQASLASMTAERDSLGEMLAQKDSLLSVQSQQADVTIKMLQQRQAALEKNELPVSHEDFARLHESLRELFTSEGQVLHSELLDTKKLTAMVRDLREKMLQYDSLQSLLQREQGANSALHRQFNDYRQQIDSHERSKADLLQQQERLKAQLVEARDRIAALENQQQQQQVSAYQQPISSHHQVFNSESNSLYSQHHSVQQMSGALEVQLRTENNLLRDQLVLAQSECARVKEESRAAHEAQQRELSSLWTSMQELNRVDAAKDHSIAELVRDRDRALAERDVLVEKLRATSQECAQLQHEMREIDADLLAAVDRLAVNGSAPQHSSVTGYGNESYGDNAFSLHRVPDRMVQGVMRRRQQQGSGTSPSNASTAATPGAIGATFGGNHSQFTPQHPHQPQAQQMYPGSANQSFPNSHLAQQQPYAPPPPPSFGPAVDHHSHQLQTQSRSVHQSVSQQYHSSIDHQQHLHQQQQQQQQQFPHQQNPPPSRNMQQGPPQPQSAFPPQLPQHQQQQSQFSAHHISSSNSVSSISNRNSQSQFGQQTSSAPLTHHQQLPQQQQQAQQRSQSAPRRPVTAAGGGNIPGDDDSAYELSEKILQRQIEELSDFLDDEAKLKRSRLQRGSNGSLSSLALSGGAKKHKLYTPTTKLNFEF